MPWVRKYPNSNTRIWAIGILAGICFGLLFGYEWWGSTAAVVPVVERELNSMEAHIHNLENRVIRLEARLTAQESNAARAGSNDVDRKTPDDLVHSPDRAADTADVRSRLTDW
jgi:hypothetical protein